MKRLTAIAVLSAAHLLGQDDYQGADISSAIPITFGQVANDTMDYTLKPRVVYKITLARGQKITALLSVPSSSPIAGLGLHLYPPSTRTVANNACRAETGVANIFQGGRSVSFDYQIATAGDYFVMVCPHESYGVNYQLQVKAEGTPLLTALPPQSGCLFGQVDYLDFSLRLIAMNLPDRISIGGTEACESCTVKPPLYDAIVQKLEQAMRASLNVEACYDDKGNIFKVKVQR